MDGSQHRHFEKRLPEENIFRFYSAMVCRDLFGSACLVVEWGRIGGAARRKTTVFSSWPDATRALDGCRARRLRRGYEWIATLEG